MIEKKSGNSEMEELEEKIPQESVYERQERLLETLIEETEYYG